MNLEGLVLVTGGAGYVGAEVVSALLERGAEVRILDNLLHRQDEVAAALQAKGAELIDADIRDGDRRREALRGATAVVHLAAIVGDPACARDPELAQEVNVEATRDLVEDAGAAGVTHFIFSSTCSNYGRMADPETPIDETGELAPVSLYAEQKVGIEKMLLGRDAAPKATCLRFATVYGAAPRMRFDLTVNEFTRELWADRDLEVFGEQFWRPYVHARDAAKGVATVLEAGPAEVGGDVFNVGHSDENYTKRMLVDAALAALDGVGEVDFQEGGRDPRNYRVSFDKINSRLGFEARRRVPTAVANLVGAVRAGVFDDVAERPFFYADHTLPRELS
jgi:nucleoside-diphosphate-sugar epimerase